MCNSAHRDHLAREKQWDEFHSLLMQDTVHADVRDVLRRIQSTGINLLMLTGRPEEHYQVTTMWLSSVAEIDPEAIIMRPKNDFRSDPELKPALLYDFFGSKDLALAKINMILDDRDKVVEGWRNLGFRCWQTQPGGY